MARLAGAARLAVRANGTIAVSVDGHPEALGKFSARAAQRAKRLRTGIPVEAFDPPASEVEKEIHRLARRLAQLGLLEYALVSSRTGRDWVVIEPQAADYWPRIAPLGRGDAVVLSRFACLRRRGNDLVLESPRALAAFRICEPAIAAALAGLTAPHEVSRIHWSGEGGGLVLPSLLVDCQILFKVDRKHHDGSRAGEGDASLVLWDFHDLLFHARSTKGRHANPMGGMFSYAGSIKPLPAVRPSWPGRRIDLPRFPQKHLSSAEKLLGKRHSTRDFDRKRPITLAELARFLDGTARVTSKERSRIDEAPGRPIVEYALRPYPSGGASYELELYLAVDNCAGLARGFYHYDAEKHALVPLAVRPGDLAEILRDAQAAMGAPSPPQVMITMAARFGRVSWKYQSIAYALILKHVGVLMQTFYLMATAMGLGACAIGSVDIARFAKITGIDFHIEGPVGAFAIGRSAVRA